MEDKTQDDRLDDWVRRIYKIVVADTNGGYEDKEDVRSVLKEAIVQHKKELLYDILDEDTEELDVTDVERFEYQHDGLPMVVIQPKYVERRLAALPHKNHPKPIKKKGN